MLDWVEASLRAAAAKVKLETTGAPQLASTVFRGMEIHSVALRFCHAPLRVLWLRDDRRRLGGPRFGTGNKNFVAGLAGLGLPSDFHDFQGKKSLSETG
jgi:hypothetical protein